MVSLFADIAFLTRSEHRVCALIAMAARPRSRSELGEITGASASTIRRTLSDFEDRNWIERDGYQYQATELGSFIATGMTDLLERFETERQVRSVWEWLPESMDDFSLDMCGTPTVTIATAEDPYRPVSRFGSLLESADRLRFTGFDVAVLEPTRSTLCERICEGMKAELIAPPRVVRYVRNTYPEAFQDPLESGNLTIQVHEDLPSYGVAVFDQQAAIVCYDVDGVMVRVLLEGTGEAFVDWAQSVFDRYDREIPTIAID